MGQHLRRSRVATAGAPAVALGVAGFAAGLALGVRDRRFLLLPAVVAVRALWRMPPSTTARAVRGRAETDRAASAVATDLALAEHNDRYAG